MTNESSLGTSRIKTVSFLKYFQSILLFAIGFSFSFYNLSLFDNPEEVFRRIAYVLGILFAIYGGLSLLTGYIVEKTPFSQNAVFGTLFIGLGFVLLLNSSVIYEIFSIVTIASLISFSVIFLIHSIYLMASKKTRKRKGLLITLSIFASVFCAGLVLLYFYADINFPERYNNGIDGGERMTGIILGPAIILIGFVNIIVTAKRAKNTKLYFASTKNKANSTQTKKEKKEEETYYTKSNYSAPNNAKSNTSSYQYSAPKKDNFASSFGFSNTKNTNSNNQSSGNNQSSNKEREPEIIDIRPKN